MIASMDGIEQDECGSCGRKIFRFKTGKKWFLQNSERNESASRCPDAADHKHRPTRM